ncbi:MAG: hypothetical protein M1602_03105, partial [Firmicutes bacterium]|nr:hypothetical protein [Bacillota bacterium]
MDQAEFLRRVISLLESLGLDYMVGGSQASIYYGEPRQTNDVDIVDPVMVEVLRLKTGAERLRIAHGMWASTRARLDAYLRREHP